MNWGNILPAVIALVGVFVGSVSTYYSQLLLLNREIKRDNEKKKESILIETLSIYSKFLDEKGKLPIIQRLHINKIKIDLSLYEKHIKPIFMEKIYLIHSDVSQIIMDINKQIEICNFNEEVTAEENDWLVSRFFELELLVFNHINDYRKNNDLHDKSKESLQ